MISIYLTLYKARLCLTTNRLEIMEYKVITMKDGFFGGKFDPAKLETALNSYAQEGWALNATATADIPGLMGGARNEIIFILERKK